MTKKQALSAMEGKHHDKPPPYSRKVLIVECPPCGGTGERVDNIIGPVGEVRVCTACGGTGQAR